MSKRRRGRHGTKGKLVPANDNQSAGVQPGAAEPDELWSTADLIPLVRLLARQAAREISLKAANDDRQSSTERPKE